MLEDWARDVLKPDDVAVQGLGPVPLGVVLRRLTACELPLTPRLAAAVRLEGPATVGEVAEALHHARTHPRGPRCRSYRSALYYLRGMERLDDEADGSNDALLS